METKTCTKCGKEDSIEAFVADRSTCKRCYTLWRRERRLILGETKRSTGAARDKRKEIYEALVNSEVYKNLMRQYGDEKMIRRVIREEAGRQADFFLKNT